MTLRLQRDGIRLEVTDFGGGGPAALLLHGLAGRAGEWTATASWLRERCRVVSFDARGHGRSERSPADVSRAAHVADAAYVIESLALAPTIVIGQSLGGHTGFLLAAARPDLVRALVVAESGPWNGGADEVETLEARLRERPRPGFDADVLVRTMREANVRSYWEEWEAVTCPMLIVRAENGGFAEGEAEEMAQRAQAARLVTIPGAGHDLHLDRPDLWRQAVTRFLETAEV